MKQILINNSSLERENLDYKVVRVKAFFVNSNNELLIAHNNNTYQLIGGHLKKEEALEDCLKREIKEETGIYIDEINNPFLNITTYDDNYFFSNKKVENSIYYFRVVSDAIPDLNNTEYDDLEIETDFNLFYIKLDEFESFINKCIEEQTIEKTIASELLIAYEEYNLLYGNTK